MLVVLLHIITTMQLQRASNSTFLLQVFCRYTATHCGKTQLFVKKNVLPQSSLILKNFKFNVRVHFIKTEFLDKNCDFVTVCVLLPYFFIEKLVYVLTHFFGRKTEVWTVIDLT